MESLYIQDNILGHFEELFLSKHCRKTALNARSPRFSPSGTWPSTTTLVGLRSVLTPSGWSLAMSWVVGKRLRALPSTILTQ